METTLSTISQMPETKEEIDSFVKKAKSEIINSNENPLKVLKQLKAIEKTVQTLLKDRDIEDYILEEAEKQGQKRFELYGVQFEVKETGTKYEFDTCNDSKWQELTEKEQEIQKDRKKREELLKSMNEEWVNPETGEIVHPAVKKSKTKVIVTFQK